MAFINPIFFCFVFSLLCVCTSKGDENSITIENAGRNYKPSPYHLEEYCRDEESTVDFHIDSWKGAIFQLGIRQGRKIHKCKVNINTNKNFWLTAAVEHMKIRGHKDRNNRWQCSDYVQFSSPARNALNKILAIFEFDFFNNKKSEKLCGEKQLDGDHLENIYDLSTDANSFSTASNRMTIVFHQDDDEKHTSSNSFTVVVTSFRHASEEAECDDKQKCFSRKGVFCIDKDFLCDGHVNCAFPGSGTDERLCPGNKKPAVFSLTSIIIAALTGTVAIGISVCIISTIICKVKSHFAVRRQPRRSSPVSASMSLAQYPSAPGVESEAPLPPYEEAASSEHLDSKNSAELQRETDLPPTYETLYPDGPVAPPDPKGNSS